MKKLGKIMGITVLIILSVILLFFAGVFINNKIQLKNEAKKIMPIENFVEIDGKKLSYKVSRKGDKIIVLLPGYMTASPIIDFKPLTDELEKDYQVVTIEPLGYGLSDDTDKKRSVENLTEEVHKVVEAEGLKNYILMGHSIFGVYSLNYIQTYPDEVEAFVGIDSSIPAQSGADDNQEGTISLLSKSGLFRLLSSASPDMLGTPAGIDAELQTQYKYLALRNIGSNATMNEAKIMPENFEKTKNMTYPKELPVLYLLASESTDSDPNWLSIHEEMVKESKKAEIKTLEGTHYLHHTKAKEITTETKKFLD